MVASRIAAALADRYRVERELGQGGMATVYLAEDLKHHRRVAIKVLRQEIAAALGAERFLREIEVAARLRHPHILPLYDSGQAAEFLYYVMPYVDGESLRDRLARERQLPVAEALGIAREVADALSYAHAHDVVHRDIKPENILLEAGHAVVADFGIAKAIASAGQGTALTQTGMSVGTPAYMSPEQAAGDPSVDGRSDLYSLGCVLYEMLAGQPPFQGPTVESLVRQHITAPAPPVTQLRPTVPAAVAEALARALAKNPADRFNPVGQFATALGAQVETAAIPTVPPRRRVLAVAATALVVLGIAAAAMFMTRAGAGTGDRSIAVLPFVQASGDTAASALAAGLHGELITELTGIGDLRVASRAAVLEYRGSGKSQADIARELGVANLLSTDIQRLGDQVRLTVSLSDPRRGRELWAERYDRQLTAENLFTLQAEVARSVASALRIRLAPADTAADAPPTSNLAALELFYRGEEEWNDRGGDEAERGAAEKLRRAVALDPGFTRAWGLLAHIESWRVRRGNHSDTLPAHQAVERASARGRETLDARLASGYYRYYVNADFAGALTEIEAASRLLPASADLLIVRALLLRRLDRWDEALVLQREAVAREPRSAHAWNTLIETLHYLRRHEEAEAAVRSSSAMGLASSISHLRRVTGLALGRGDSAAAWRAFEESAPLLSSVFESRLRVLFAVIRRDLAAAQAVPARPEDADIIPNQPHRHLLIAALARSTGEETTARAHADSLRAVAERYIARFEDAPDPFGARSFAAMNAAMAEALTGDGERAVAAAEEVVREYRIERDAVEGQEMLRWLAVTYAMAGRRAEAVATIERVLALPGAVGIGELRFLPLWDRLRGDPAFEALIR